jgi:hypothetical protein
MEMEYQPEKAKSISLFFPSEQVVIALWKWAANHPGETIQIEGFSCHLITSKNTKFTSARTNFSMMSMRELMDYLQSNCTLEFLWRHCLNSSMDTLARKYNKKWLVEIAQSYQGEVIPLKPDDSIKNEILESLLKHFIQPVSNAIICVKSLLNSTARYLFWKGYFIPSFCPFPHFVQCWDAEIIVKFL